MFQPHNTKKEKEMRRVKYEIAKKLGYNTKFAYRVRDWRFTKIALLILNKPNLPGSRN